MDKNLPAVKGQGHLIKNRFPPSHPLLLLPVQAGSCAPRMFGDPFHNVI